MAITIGASAGTTYASNAVVFTLPSHSQGDLLLVCVSRHGPSDPNTQSISTMTAGWTQVYDHPGSAYSPKLALWRKFAGASEPNPTVTFAGATSGTWHSTAFSGVDATQPISTFTPQTIGASTTITMPGGTGASDGAILFGQAAANNNNNSYNAGVNGWTERSDPGAEYNHGVTGTTSVAAGTWAASSWTNTVANAYASAVTCLNPSGGTEIVASITNWSDDNATVQGSDISSDPVTSEIGNSRITNVSNDCTFWADCSFSLSAGPTSVTLQVSGGPVANYPPQTSGTLKARLYMSNQSTPLTDEVTMATWTSASPDNAVLTFVLPNAVTGNLAAYSTARLRLIWDQV